MQKKELAGQLVYIFGSRALNSAAESSDVDLFIEGEVLSYLQVAKLQDAFSRSDLPYFIDVV